MTQHGDELVSQLGRFSLVEQISLAGSQPINCVEMESDQFSEQLEHRDCFGRFDPGGLWIDRTKSPEKRAIREIDRHRDIALEAIHGGSRMSTIGVVLIDVIDDDGFPVLPDFVANRRLDF